MSASPPSRIANIAFWVWVAAGPALVVANFWLADYWWLHYSWTPTFFIIGREADYDVGVRLHLLLYVFRYVSLIYGPLGVAVIRRGDLGCFALGYGFVVCALVWLSQWCIPEYRPAHFSSHASASAVVAQPLAAMEMNWSFSCGKPLS
jgi:hypothetical protein